MKRNISCLVSAIALISGCVGNKSDRIAPQNDARESSEPLTRCVCEKIPIDVVLEDHEGTYLLKAVGRDLTYWYKGVDTSTHAECQWMLQHISCSSEHCSYRNKTTRAMFSVSVTNGMLVVRKKGIGRNLGVEPMFFDFVPNGKK